MAIVAVTTELRAIRVRLGKDKNRSWYKNINNDLLDQPYIQFVILTWDKTKIRL